jgi:hypothetical protein
MVMRAFSRLGSLTAGWGRSSSKKAAQQQQQLQQQLAVQDKKKWSSSHDCSQDTKGKDTPTKEKAASGVPRLSVCADAQKVDRTKLAQSEVILDSVEKFVRSFPIIRMEIFDLQLI